MIVIRDDLKALSELYKTNQQNYYFIDLLGNRFRSGERNNSKKQEAVSRYLRWI